MPCMRKTNNSGGGSDFVPNSGTRGRNTPNINNTSSNNLNASYLSNTSPGT